MNTPFKLQLQVEEINWNPTIDELPIMRTDKYPINVTLNHTPEDIFQLIWYNSPNYLIRPVFLSLYGLQGRISNHMTFKEILDTEEPPTDVITSLKLVVDYELFGSPSISTRDPMEELFDIVIEWNDKYDRINSIKIRESLKCTSGNLKSYIADERNSSIGDDDMEVDGSYFNLRYWADDDIIRDNDLTLRTITGLDVTPKVPILFELLYNFEKLSVGATDQSSSVTDTNRRFFIKFQSTIDSLQGETSLFEVNKTKTLRELKNDIIHRVDEGAVSRTFFDQVKLYYYSELINSTENDRPLYEALSLSDELLDNNRNIITMQVVIHEHLSGVEGGILSREFWDDIRGRRRFEFLPTTRDDLQVEAETPHGVSLQNSNNNIREYEPAKIILDNGAEWSLTGETYEMIQADSPSIPNTLLVNQTDISSLLFEFSLTLPGKTEPTNILLNSSQCIVVDNGKHNPYILLNSSGASKLNRHFRDIDGTTLLQQVHIHLFEDRSTSQPDQPNQSSQSSQPSTNTTTHQDVGPIAPEAPQEQIQNQQNQQRNNIPLFQIARFPGLDRIIQVLRDRSIFTTIIRIGLITFVFGFEKFILEYWTYILAWTILINLSFQVLFKSFTLADRVRNHLLTDQFIRRFGRNYERMIRKTINGLIQIGIKRITLVNQTENKICNYIIQRPREYEYLVIKIKRQDTIKFYIKDCLKNFLRSSLMMVITFMPLFVPKLNKRLEIWRCRENLDLKTAILEAYDQYCKQVPNNNYNINNVIEYATDIEDDEGIEVQYQIFLDQLLHLLVLLVQQVQENQPPAFSQQLENQPEQSIPQPEQLLTQVQQ